MTTRLDTQEHRHTLPKGFKLQEYQIERVLGKPGGFGVTYLALDTNLHQSVAIKEYMPGDFAVRDGVSSVCVRSQIDESSFQWGLQCFLDEARILAKFKHPNIVRVLRFFEENGTAYMVMEYQEGYCLADYLKEKEKLVENELLDIALPLMDGLQQVHEMGLLHRDIKPNNIYIRHDRSPVLLDFGSARYAVSQRSRSVTSIVSPGYAPLEQYDNILDIQGAWTDIYALGAVMYRSISGEDPPAATRRVIKDPMIPAVEIGKNRYRQALLQAIDWALALSEEDRPRSIVAWREKIMLPPPEQVQHSPQKKIDHLLRLNQAQRYVAIIAGITIVGLALTVGVLLDKHRELIAALETQKNTYETTLQTERTRFTTQLAEQSDAISNVEKNARQLQNTIEQLSKFGVQTAMESFIANVENGEPLPSNNVSNTPSSHYFKVSAKVADDDVLNVRQFPNPRAGIVGIIPPASKCVLYLDTFYVFKNAVWVLVQFDNVKGWVNSSFLVETQECPPHEQ
ncbi:serine/threonine protein kinase [Beggiatoa leptomitoformis]|uniref:non-specific serine/threonine protein kinase n=1 Tax=Beggiatoa leptomitoformis TaxID=288004 RepID=A0A2N9YCL7_9GAMM|nr:serine/threonine protein kinase [Beggiatoa leptomitoformis]AUI68202.1 protein kinase [Beggiatoa leptomitoformis]QGX03439.1 protein kinase [Beggiatoa leptomitoformis]